MSSTTVKTARVTFPMERRLDDLKPGTYFTYRNHLYLLPSGSAVLGTHPLVMYVVCIDTGAINTMERSTQVTHVNNVRAEYH